MILAILTRTENMEVDAPFNERFYLTTYFKDVFDKLGILLFPVISDQNLEQVCDMCDGLIIPGSVSDINPHYYHDEPLPDKDYTVDEFKLDKKAIDLFTAAEKPILGICGGLQAINVAFGGTLHQRIPDHNIGIEKTHSIDIEPGTFLSSLYGDSAEINSYHTQAVKDVAASFKASGISKDGIVEAMERGNIIGVQWHPEQMGDMKFFEGFVETYLKR